ncbi:hypothetical protein M5C97_01085 [Acidovorax sp. NCPPB 3859]|nr:MULTISPECIES: hypothetical protein [unclassified Acidovorax]MDA8451069.1 hypothetical protein [Acidovorax sp. GBBC 3297]MDA8460514.1 hypothetical protein [Acidovorax sp. GBBC 3333]MDA8465550.1 hypothetical protein [Acidovorax sp. GBBC 3332]MDA8470453.1 hypothetical protein [Acidovorax sp. GBBC 3299]WCM78918.1 hypothetical protein M5C94_01085 [Acidovorax sp. GBBC 712]
MGIQRSLLTLSAALVGVFLVGCAGPAPNYSPSVSNVEKLKKMDLSTAKVGAFTPKAGMPNAESIGLRAASMVSPVGKNYGDYLAAALKSELELAKLYDPASTIEVSGTLIENNINAGGISKNDGQLEAQFVVKDGATVRYDKTKKITREWEGAFAGGVAIPQAANNYPLMVQQLLGELFSDPDFVAAVKKR